VNPELGDKFEINRYRPLGLVANPFSVSDASRPFDPRDLEIASQSNLLLKAIDESANEPSAKPILVLKNDEMPAYFPNRAISRVERSLASDDGFDVLHAYILMFMMRMGRVRAILQIVAERITFRDFGTTLQLYVKQVLAEPDTELVAYQVLGDEGLAAYRARFDEDPKLAVNDVFGHVKLERRPELVEVADTRPADLQSNVDEEDGPPEIDSTIMDAPGTEMILASEIPEEELADRAVLDYIVEYTKVHLSPVIARALRVYHDRGLAALTTELTITKAPRKTLAALVRFARVRFRKIALVFDGFDAWPQTPAEIRTEIASTLSEVRWMLEADAVVVMVLDRSGSPELEEQFGAGKHVDWDFPGLSALETAGDAIDVEAVDRWLAASASSDKTPLTVGDPVLSALLELAEGSLSAFCATAGVAIESAAERGVSALDAEALEAGKAARTTEADAE
jgi:hypothetical protein